MKEIVSTIESLFTGLPRWSVWAGAVAAAANYLIPGESVRTGLATCLVLMTVDLVSALVAASAQSVPIESRRISRTVSKLVSVCLMVGVLAALLRLVPTMGSDSIGAVLSGALGLIAFREGVSIMENLTRAGLPVPAFVIDLLRTRAQEPPTPKDKP